MASDGNEVERPVELAIATSIEPVPVVVLTGGDLDGCGAAESRVRGFAVASAGLCGGRNHALACLLALNGLRISEALGADIDNLDVNRRTALHRARAGRPITANVTAAAWPTLSESTLVEIEIRTR